MDKETFEIKAMDYMTEGLSSSDKIIFEQFLEDNPDFKEKYAQLKESWEIMQYMSAPEPSTQMDESFFTMLSKEMDKMPTAKPRNFFGDFFGWVKPQLVLGIVLLACGLVLGYYLSPGEENKLDSKTIVDNETEEVRQKLVLTLLEQPSANQRLQGVGEANKIGDVDEIVIKALLKTLNSDSNVNVRLAAVESLTNYVDNPLVRQGLVQAIPYQESPIMQVTLANLMVALQEKASIEPFRKLLKEQELDTTVKKKIKNSIESII